MGCSLCNLRALCVFVVCVGCIFFTTETQSTRRLHREEASYSPGNTDLHSVEGCNVTSSASEPSSLVTREVWPLPVVSSTSRTSPLENVRVSPSLAVTSQTPVKTANRWRPDEGCQSASQPAGAPKNEAALAAISSERNNGGMPEAKSTRYRSDSISWKCDSPCSSVNSLTYAGFISDRARFRSWNLELCTLFLVPTTYHQSTKLEVPTSFRALHAFDRELWSSRFSSSTLQMRCRALSAARLLDSYQQLSDRN